MGNFPPNRLEKHSLTTHHYFWAPGEINERECRWIILSGSPMREGANCKPHVAQSQEATNQDKNVSFQSVRQKQTRERQVWKMPSWSLKFLHGHHCLWTSAWHTGPWVSALGSFLPFFSSLTLLHPMVWAMLNYVQSAPSAMHLLLPYGHLTWRVLFFM